MSSPRRLRLFLPIIALPLLSGGLLAKSATAATATVQAESLELPTSQGQIRADSTAVGGRALILWSNGTATGAFSGAADTVTVRARGEQCAGAPQITISVDSRQIFATGVPATSWTNYKASVGLSAGTHQIGVTFGNDYLGGGCDRNILVDQLVFDQAALPTTSPSPPATPDSAVGIEAETMALPAASGQVTSDPAASGGRALLVWSSDTAGTTANLPAASAVTVRARGDQCAGAPQLKLSIDGQQVFSATVSGTAWADYRGPLASSTGSHQVTVTFTNDYRDSNCDRNVYVDKLTFSTSAPSGTPAPTAGSSPSGIAMPVGDLPGWRQTFRDDFTTAAPLGSFDAVYGPRWSGYCCGDVDTSKQGTYSPGKVLSAANGTLDYYLHTENGTHYVAAPLPRVGGSGPEGGQVYGRYSVRFKSDAIYGYKIAWLLWPDSERSPDDGELDFPEANLNGTIFGAAHYADPTDGQQWVNTGTALTSWHTATIEWTPGKVVMLLDGAAVLTNTVKVPVTPMHWVLQAETNLDGTQPVNNTAAGHVSIDWVTAYSLAP